MMSIPRRRVIAAAAAIPLATPALAAFPDQAVSVVVPWNAGGLADLSIRVLAPAMGGALGQPVVIENRGGANGALGTQAVARAAPNGHTLILANAETHAINPLIYPRLPYDPQRDFAPIRPTLQTDFFVAVAKDSPFKTIDDIVQAAQAAPDRITYGSWGLGSPGHLGALRLLAATNTRMTHVPYKEIPQLFAAVATGEVQWALGSIASAGPMEKSGRIRFVGVASPQPSPFAPGVPGMAGSAQAKAFVANAWFALFAPRNTPKPLREKIAADITEVLATADIADRYRNLGYNRFDQTPDEFGEYIVRETQLWGRVIADARLKLD